MAFSITPNVESWLNHTETFTIRIKAFDDNGIQCRNKELSIKYNITYDGTMPDLIQMEEMYSDASGIIALVISRPCVISLFGTHVRDIKDASKGSVTQEIAINYEISFKPTITELNVAYNGPDIEVSDLFNINDLIVKATLSDGTTANISPTDCTVDDFKIYNIDENLKTLTYIESLTKTTWTAKFVINGIPKLLSLDAEYIGDKKIIGDRVLPEELIVHGSFLISTKDTEYVEISKEKWYFIDIPIITKDNNGILKIKYKDKEARVSVPYKKIRTSRLNVWYEGSKIEVGSLYDPYNIVIYLIEANGKAKRIPWTKCQVDSFVVKKEGLNWFTVTYVSDFKKITQTFYVEGFISKKFPDLEFKVLYVQDPTSAREEDQLNLTEAFEEKMRVCDVLVVNWNLFLEVANSINKYGLYIVTIPKLSGLSNKYDMDWEVLCINKNTIKATAKKIYKEEQNNG